MKKLFAFVLAFTLVAATAVPALAEDNTTASVTGDNKSASIPVTGSYKGPGDVISVDVVWDAMNFTYAEDNVGTWNPKTHKYENPTKEGWSWDDATDTKTAPEIKLTNHSNVGVKAAFGFAANTEISGPNGKFTDLTDGAFTLDTAVGTTLADAPSKSTAFSLEGNGITGKDVKLGEITVTISKDDTNPGVVYNSFDELQSAINNASEGETITLGADIDDTNNDTKTLLRIYSENDIVLDLNGHTLTSTCDGGSIWNQGTLTIKNGTIICVDRINNENSLTAVNLTVKNENGSAIVSATNTVTNLTGCTLYSGASRAKAAALELRADAHIVDCKVTKATSSDSDAGIDGNSRDAILIEGNEEAPYTLTIGGNTTVDQYIMTGSVYKLIVEEDSSFNLDDHIDKSVYDTTQDSATGTWTVTRKAESQN